MVSAKLSLSSYNCVPHWPRIFNIIHYYIHKHTHIYRSRYTSSKRARLSLSFSLSLKARPFSYRVVVGTFFFCFFAKEKEIKCGKKRRNRRLQLFMDRCSGKRVAGRLVTPRKAYSVTAFKDAATEADQNAQFCNRIGCSGRIKCSQNARIESSDKSKCSKPSFRSSNGNEITGKSSRSNSMMASAKKSCVDSKRKMSSQEKFDPSESSLSSESEAPVLVSSSSNLSGYQSESMNKSKEVTMTEAGSSSASSNVGPRKIFHHKSGLRNQNTLPATSVPSASKSSALGPFNRSNGSRYGLRNLKCNSISDVVPPSCSPLESESVGKNMMKKSSSEGESSFSRRGRKITAPSPIDRHISPTTSGISISHSTRSSSASGEVSSGNGSIWTRRSMNVNTRMRFSCRQNGRNSSSVREPAVSFSQIHDNEIPFNVGDRSSLQQFSVSGSRSYRLSSSNGDNPSSRMPFSSAEPGLTHLMNHDVLHRYNMDGIAEVLLALERIEQDEELTHEQVLALETSLFLSGLNLYDQHRDMRLDIDNMSYEELLALEERMGTVSTALSKEALSKCLRRSIYQATPSKVEITGSGEDGDDIKCSICQEEYVNGDEIGKLVECQHGYHATCINQWLQLKNWCPICKASAATPSQSSSSS